MKPLYVEWLDHCSPDDGGWHDLRAVRNLRPAKCVTLGFVVNETPEFLTLAGTVGEPDDGSCGGEMLIIKRNIVKRRVLKWSS